MAMKFRLNLID